MTDYMYGVDATGGVTSKPHGFVSTGYEALSSNFEFITITTTVDIRTNTPAGGGSYASQAALDKLIQIVSLRGQPIIMGNVGAGPNYKLMLTIEHPYAWQCTATAGSTPSASYVTAGPPPSGTDATHLGLPWPDARAGEDLANRIGADGINYGFTVGNTSVLFSNVLT